MIYLPLTPFIMWYAFRNGGIAVCTACNPSIPMGGLVGESKADILSLLPPDTVIPFHKLERTPIEERVLALLQHMNSRQWEWPIVLKPDEGCRGRGVSLIYTLDQARQYLIAHPEPVLMQAYHPGPLEAGIFYARQPGDIRGRIISITSKQFPEVVGDGVSTVKELIWSHPRHRAQAMVHMEYLGSTVNYVPFKNKSFALGFAGNHSRGTMFLDGSELLTPELEAAFDRISLQTQGFCFGRFDVRYASDEELKLGSGFAIVELNGLTSESTNIYDPSTSFFKGQRVLRNQWKTAYAIGAANCALGAQCSHLSTIVQALVMHIR
jgi:hypothetical protein